MKNELLKENYEVKNMLVKGLSSKIKCFDFHYNISKEKVYDIEYELSEPEKLEIVDSHTDGLGTYLLNIIIDYKAAKEEGVIKSTTYGSLHRGSVTSWIKKHDFRKALYQGYPESYPTYYIFGNKFRMELTTPHTEFGYKMTWDGDSVINQWFHILLKLLENGEEEYYKENDKDQINLTKLGKLVEKFNSFLGAKGFEDLWDMAYNGKELDPKTVRFYLNKLTEIEEQVNKSLEIIKTIEQK